MQTMQTKADEKTGPSSNATTRENTQMQMMQMMNRCVGIYARAYARTVGRHSGKRYLSSASSASSANSR